MENESQHRSPTPDYLLLLHRWSGLISAPFLILSVLVAVSLTHTRLLNYLSEQIFESLPIPQFVLEEEVRPGSWDQALTVASLVTGQQGNVITSRDDNTVVVQAFMKHSHDPHVMKINPHTQVIIDTQTMKVVRVQDKSTSLVGMGHAIHAFRFFDMEYFSLSLISSGALLVLIFSGGVLAWRDRKVKKVYAKPIIWHIRLGQAVSLLLLIVVATTLDFEFSFLSQSGHKASHPIPEVRLDAPLRPGSVDQARNLVEQATGAPPQAAYIRKNGDDVKFSEDGDGIGGKSVFMNINTMRIERITDWRNDRQALTFILHDGRWLGGMNAFNINDAVALVLLWLVLGGAMLYRLKRRNAA